MSRGRNRIFSRNTVVATHDAMMAAASFLLALYLRFGDFDAVQKVANLPLDVGLFTLLAVLFFVMMRLYRGLWRFASIRDLVNITKAVSLSILVFYTLLFLLTRLADIPRSVPVIHWLLLLAMLGGPRFVYRLAKDRLLGRPFSLVDDRRIPVVLVGVNEHAEHFLRETQRSSDTSYRVVGIVDDNPRWHGQVMHGARIYSDIATLPTVIRKLIRRGEPPQRLVLTNDRLEGSQVRRLLEIAEEHGLVLARLPQLTEFKSSVREGIEIRPIAVEDLLGRAQNTHDRSLMRQLIEGKRVLVTGAGGSIGSELVRQLAAFSPAKLVLFDQSEYHLYLIDGEMGEKYADVVRVAVIGDVRDAAHLDKLFHAHQPEVVFHAAAIKHVPLAEGNVEEAIFTNVFGTQNVADACVDHHVATMVLVSTDKAVNPANVMGATKRLAESYCQALGGDAKARKKTRFITVRFGNVLGSTGSVVPLFERQLKRGGPITVTHPDVVRFFMTIREAVELVLQAAAMGAISQRQDGLIFVLDMGQPVRIEDLAVQMIKLAGLRPHEDIAIEYTGLRPGEKMFEELFHFSEESIKTDHEGIMLASSRRQELASLRLAMAKLLKFCQARDRQHAFSQLKAIVPEFRGAVEGESRS